jgi:thioredoxin reductase (NADPH)
LQKYDVIIIGGGPAGMSAAVWCADLGLRSILIDRGSKLGGQLHWTHNPITNYLGAVTENGSELAAKFAEQIERAQIDVVVGYGVTSADLKSKNVIADGRAYAADAIVIATGVRRRKLGVPGEDEFVGRGILVSGALDRETVRDKTVVIVGGGDAALENAVILSEHAKKVHVVHRRARFSARDEFVARARAVADVEFVFDSVVTAIGGDTSVEHASFRKHSGEMSSIACDAILIRIGVEPNTDLFKGQIELDKRGYVVVQGDGLTTMPGVWAIGDVTESRSMTIAHAVGNGAEAARSIFEQLGG